MLQLILLGWAIKVNSNCLLSHACSLATGQDMCEASNEEQVNALLIKFMTWACLTRDLEMQKEGKSHAVLLVREG